MSPLVGLVVVLVIVLQGCDGQSPEFKILMQLYNETNGDHWKDKTNWFVGEPCTDNWYGISCWTPSVNKIDLSGNNLNGRVFESLIQLTLLSEIILPNNEISGTIPTGIGNLSLHLLHLFKTNLSGSVPEEFYQMSSLVFLDISSNLLSGTISPSIANLKLLIYIVLNGNNFTGSLPLLSSPLLQSVDLSFNSFSGTIPDSYYTLTSLQELYLTYNFLGGTLSDNWRNLVSLNALGLDHNYFEGTIPTTIATLPNLNSLYLSTNQLNGTIPTEIALMEQLFDLRLDTNNFVGSIPQLIEILPHLQTFFIQNNPNLCDACFRFQKTLLFCHADSLSTNCSCDYTPCGQDICDINQACIDQCPGTNVGLGICINGVLKLTSLNTKSTVSLSNISSFINGDVSIPFLQLSNSTLTINGTLSGNNSTLNLQKASISLINLVLLNSFIELDIQSSLSTSEQVNLKHTQIIVNFNNATPPQQETLLISSPLIILNDSHIILQDVPLTLECESYQILQSISSIFLVKSQGGCSPSPSPPSSSLPWPIIIGSAVGGVCFIGVVVAIVYYFRRQWYLKQQTSKIRASAK